MCKFITNNEGGITISTKVNPGAKKNTFAGIWNDRYLKIMLQAPAVDGKANDALISFLSKELDVKKRNITIISGETSRTKILHLEEGNKDERIRIEEWLKQKLLMESK